jgi:hypothetical protein
MNKFGRSGHGFLNVGHFARRRVIPETADGKLGMSPPRHNRYGRLAEEKFDSQGTEGSIEGRAGNLEVAMADEMSVVFAEVVGGVFVVSDLGPDDDEPTE